MGGRKLTHGSCPPVLQWELIMAPDQYTRRTWATQRVSSITISRDYKLWVLMCPLAFSVRSLPRHNLGSSTACCGWWYITWRANWEVRSDIPGFYLGGLFTLFILKNNSIHRSNIPSVPTPRRWYVNVASWGGGGWFTTLRGPLFQERLCSLASNFKICVSRGYNIREELLI